MAHCTQKCLATLGLFLFAGPTACVDPFAKTTTPAKYGTKPQAGSSKGKSATDKGAQHNSDKAKGDKKKDEQTYQQAWTLICNAEELAKPDPSASPRERNDAVAEWLVAHLTNQKARYWFLAFAKKKKKPEREVFFRAEAQQAGMKQCPFADVLFAPDASKADKPGPTSAPLEGGEPTNADKPTPNPTPPPGNAGK